ncbi:MAG: Bug family tripartite tricarboxylate transporter substrate binding protein [Beijerinckiaceae bacterium]
MKTIPRVVAGTFLALALIPSLPIPAQAQSCPGPLKIVVAFPPGSPDDVIARILAQRFGASGEAAMVENIPGASGKIGTAAVARAAADGCTLLVANANATLHAAGASRTPYDIRTSFAPVAFLIEAPETISVYPALPASTMPELVALLKANPGKYAYASPGFASTPHLAAESLFRNTLGLEVTHVPHQGGPPAINATIGGHTHIVHLTLPVVASAAKDGKLRMLAVAATRRHPMFPDVPTLAEVGISKHDVGFWNALVVPQGTPQAVIDRLHQKVSGIMANAEVSSQLAAMGFTPRAGSQADLARFIADDIAKAKDMLERTKITLE